jgi:MoaA/NifB/PqqE/SkfB family radical SAM enzyme
VSEPRIIRVEPTEEYFSLNWQIDIRCNYDCMYCSPEWHDNTSDFKSLEELQDAWRKVFDQTKNLNLPYKISFVGGELTANKNFLPFVTWLRANYAEHLFKVMVTTNGSASTRYYEKMIAAIDNITFSVHTEHINEEKFFNMILDLSRNLPNGKFLQVIIMNEYWNKDRIPMYVELLEDNNISYLVNDIDYSYKTREHPIFFGKLNFEGNIKS